MSTIALEANGLSKRYRARGPWALHEVDLAIAQGGIVGLVGPNGAGKSTLLRIWMGFERPTQGSVSVRGVDPIGRPGETIPHLGYIPQTPALYRDLSVGDHLALAAHYRARTFDRPWAEQRLVRLRIDLAERVGALSGGQSAQVSLAIAIALRAEVLLLDEPLAHLDPLARREFLTTLVDDVQTTGATAVLSSHLISDIEMACDRLIVLANGRTLLADSVSHARSSHRVVASAAAGAADVVSALPGRAGVLVRTDGTAGPGNPATLEEVVIAYLAAAR